MKSITFDKSTKERTENKEGRGERKTFDRKPFDKERGERKPFDKERKSFDKEKNDRKSFDRDRKPFDRERKSFDKKGKNFGAEKYEHRGNFRRNHNGEIEEREGAFRARGERKFNPDRPMFHKNFDYTKNVLDFSQSEEEN